MRTLVSKLKQLGEDKQRMRLVGGLLIVIGIAAAFQLQGAKGAAYTWDGGGTDGTCGGAGTANNWSCAANWSSDIVPGAADTVTFNATSTKNATITSAVSVTSITIASGYTCIITQSGANTVTTSGAFSQATGTFTGGSGSITVGDFTLSGGTFTSTTGTLLVNPGWTHTDGGTFNHNNGTVRLGPNTATVNVNTTETFNNLIIGTVTTTNIITISSGDTLIVLGTFTHDGNAINTGTVEPRGPMIVTAGARGGTGTISFLVAGDQTITPTAGGNTASISINKSSGTVNLVGGATFTIAGFTQSSGDFNGGIGTITDSGNFVLSGGSFTSTSGNLSVAGTFTQSAGTFAHNNGTVVAALPNATTRIWDVDTTITFNNLTFSGSNGSNCTMSVAAGDTIVVLGTFAQTTGLVGGTGTIEVRGNMTAGANSASTGTIAFLVEGDQTITQGGSGGGTSILNINKPSGTVSFANSNNMTIGGLTLSSGTFTSTSGTLTVSSGNWTHTGGIFNHNNGTVTSNAGGTNIFDVAATETFNNLTITGTDFNRFTDISTGDTLIVTGTFTHTTTSLRGGTVEVRGPMVGGSSVVGSNASTTTILFNQTGDQTITASGGGTAFLNIAKPSGTVTLSGNYTVRGYTQSSGAFNAGTGTFTNVLNFTLTGGTFTSTTGTFSAQGHWTHTSGNFIHNTGTVAFEPQSATTWNIDVPGSEQFNNLTINGFDLNRWVAIASGDRAIVNGTFTHSNGVLNGPGIIEALGNVSITSGSDGGSAGITFAGTLNQTFTLTSAEALFNGDLTVNKGGGKVTMQTGLTLDAASQDLTITAGAFDLGPANIVTVSGAGGSVVINTNGVLQGTGTGGSFILGVNLTNNGTVLLNSNGLTCGDADSIQIRSTVGGTQRSWSGIGKFFLTDVDVRDQGGSATIVANSSTFGSNMGANWTANATCNHTVSTPNGAESWPVRSSQTITWTAYSGTDHYRLFYSTNSGGSWTEIGTTASTSYNWTVPLIQTSTARILVAAENSGNTVLAQDMSDADFTFLTFGTTLKGGIQFKGGVTF